jgi:arylsulfatase A-like enzyme
MTAVQPSRFGRSKVFGFAIPRRLPTVAGILHERGWQTAAVSASPIVRKTRSSKNPAGGYGRGFDQFHESCLDREAACVNKQARKFLDSLAEPFFLYLHYMEPHDPYDPPDSFEQPYARPHDGPDFIAAGDPSPIAAMTYAQGPQLDIRDEDWQHLIDLYDDEINYFDAHFGELLSDLDARGLADRTIVALVADHGEEFAEHRDVMHCRSVADVQMHTPLVIRVPGVSPARVAAPVSNVDLVPTLLDYLQVDLQVDLQGDPQADPRVDGERFDFDGHSLRGFANAPDRKSRPVFGAWRGSSFVLDGRFKLIFTKSGARTRLYDIVADPGETRDLSETQSVEADRLRSVLLAHLGASSGETPQPTESDTELMNRLRALGYLK